MYFFRKFVYNRDMSKADNHNDAVLDKDALIAHAKEVLNSKMSGVKIAKGTEINLRQIYDYRSGRRNIDKAYYDTLLKFEHLYQEKIKKNDHEGKKNIDDI